MRRSAGSMLDGEPPSGECTISQLAGEFGVTMRAIRFYEDCGLLAPRRIGAMRIYGGADRTRLERILRAKRLGMALAEIKDWLGLYESSGDQAPRALLDDSRWWIAQMERRLDDLTLTLAELRQIERAAVERVVPQGIDSRSPATNINPRELSRAARR